MAWDRCARACRGLCRVRIDRRRPEKAPAIAMRITVGMRNAPDGWRDYLYWNVELDDS